MDGKTKKIFNYLKKSGGEADLLDVSFGLNMEEDFVQNALDSLVQESLVTATRNEHGKVIYNLADGDSAPPPEKAPKKAKAKAVAGPEDHFDEFVLENEAVNLVTDTIATHIDDITHAAPPPAPPPPTPASTAVFEVDDDFSKKPKSEKKAAPPPPPPPSIDIDDDDFAPKPKKAKKPAPPPDVDLDDDDFAPKPKKVMGRKAAEFDDDAAHDYDAGSKARRTGNLIASIAAAVVVIIISVVLSVAVSSGKTASAIAGAERDLVKTLDFDTYKKETDGKIRALRARNQALETRVKSLENRARQDRSAAAAAKKPAKKGR